MICASFARLNDVDWAYCSYSCCIIPEQFTVKAQRPLLGVKKGRGEEENLFVGKSYELSRTVFKSEIGQKKFFFWQKV